MNNALCLAAAALLASGCVINTDLAGDLRSDQERKQRLVAERPTGSNIVRLKRDPALEGWRRGMDREDLEKIQRAQGLLGEPR